MGFLIGLLTVVMVLDCAVLILLVLVQLPKKDAGAGLAFGGGATDALFGAGSGNVLTNITKYAATTFFVLAVVLSIMQSYYHGRTTSVFEQKLQQATPSQGSPASTQPSPTTKPVVVPGTNALTVTPPAVENTNLPVPITPAPTSAPAAK
ncbi:MAG: preprotein translocase subunit SecG [Verrucomicrobia bacterium]|nr:preprotein translocase subunit SecG [Verrucomicrobiota bacterium]